MFGFPPKSPKLNGHVERSNRTYREEFYEVYDVDLELEEYNRQLAKWEHIYNCIRPHQSLDYLTPYQILSAMETRPQGESVSHVVDPFRILTIS